MKLQRIFIISLFALLLSVSGVWAANFNVGAPTGNPTTDTATIQTAINNAIASGDAQDFVIFNSGSTYVTDNFLYVAGTAASVTFTTSGPGRAILVGSTLAGVDVGASFNYSGIFTMKDVVNCNLGWDNLVLIPASKAAVLGATQASNTNAFGVSAQSTTNTFVFNNVVITGNVGANTPASLDGSGDPRTAPMVDNISMFGQFGLCMNPLDYTTKNPRYNKVYFKNSVISHVWYRCMWASGPSFTVYNIETDTTVNNDVFNAENCTFSWTMTSACLSIASFANVNLTNCNIHHALGTNAGFEQWYAINYTVSDCTITDCITSGLRQVNDRNVTIRNCSLVNNRIYGIWTYYSLHHLIENCNIDMINGGNYLPSGNRCIQWDARSSLPATLPREMTVRNCRFNGGCYGILELGGYQVLMENCTFNDFTRTAYFEDVATAVGSSTTTIRDCTFTNVSLHNVAAFATYDPDASENNQDLSSCVITYNDYVTLERLKIYGPGAAGASAEWGILLQTPIQVSITDCYIDNFHRAGIWSHNGSPLISGYPSDILVDGCQIVNCGVGKPGAMPPTALDDNNNAYAAVSLDQGQSLRVMNSSINTTLTDAIHVNMSGANYIDSTASIQNVQFTGCRDNLIYVAGSDFNGNQLTIDGVTENSPNPANQFAGAEAIVVQAATATISNVTLTNRGATCINNRYRTDTTQGLHVYSDIFLDTIGPDAIVASQQFNGQMQVSDTTIRNVTAGSGLSLRGGRNTMLSSVEVSGAARYGVTIGEDAITPSAPMSVGTLDDLCLFNNALGGLRILQGDRTKGSMALTNSTILGSPAQISYEPVATNYAQILWVTDCIIAGDNPGGTGISVPVVVAGGAAPAPPRVRVNTSALVQGGPWALATPVDVNAGNPVDTVLLVSQNIINKDPGFASTTPGDADFLAVRSAQYAGKATNTGPGQTIDLDGCSYYIGDLGIEAWRRF